MAHTYSRGNRRNGQKPQGGWKAQPKQGTAVTSGQVGASFSQQAAALPEPKTRVPKTEDQKLQQINTLILRKFKNLPADLQNTETKLSCANAILASHKEQCGDPTRYFNWLRNRAKEIARTFDFKEVCEKHGLTNAEEQQAVAEHLVLEGKAITNKIRLNGLATYDGNIKMFRQPLVPKFYNFDKTEEVKEGGNE